MTPPTSGRDPEALRRVGTFVELHVEQGRAWLDRLDAAARSASGRDLAARPVAARPARRADHAGTTPLADRDDPMLGLAAASSGARAAAEQHGAARDVGKVRVEPERGQRHPVARSPPGSTPRGAGGRTRVRAGACAGRRRGRGRRGRVGGVVDGGHRRSTPRAARPAGRRVLGIRRPRRCSPTGAGHDAGILAARRRPDRDALRPQPDRRLALAGRARRARTTAWPGSPPLARVVEELA